MTDLLNSAELDALRKIDTPTVCNALEYLDERFRTHGFTTQPFVSLDATLEPLVGYAMTATIRAHEKPLLSPEKLRERRFEYYEYIASGPRPGLIVIQDLDPSPGFGAFWGEVNTTVHQALGVNGVLTNGSFRDTDACAKGFQILGGLIGPSHAYVHVVDTAIPVHVHGLAVQPGALIHADHHGAVAMSSELARQVPEVAALLGRREKVILDACKAPGFSIDSLKAAIQGSADIH